MTADNKKLEEAIKGMKVLRKDFSGYKPNEEMFDMAIEALEELKTGKWIDTADEYDKRARRHDYYCSECRTFAGDFISGYEDWWCCEPPKYCPHCGAKMEVEE